MKLLFFILLILLIAHIGFWKTLGAVLGAVVLLIGSCIAGRRLAGSSLRGRCVLGALSAQR